MCYRDKGKMWQATKSIAELGLIITLAWKLPALLIAWIINWLTWPIVNRDVRITVSVFSGIMLSTANQSFLEVILLLSVFAIDRITGGVLRHWNKAKVEEGLA